MKKILTLFITIVFLATLVFVRPQEKPIRAEYTMPTLVSISRAGKVLSEADGVVNLSKYTPEFPMWNAAHLVYAEGWLIQNPNYPVGTEFQVVLDTKMQEPYVIISEGDIVSWNYNKETGHTTVNAKNIIIPGREGKPDMNGLIVAAVLGLPSGAPEQIKGTYISTNAYEWEMIPPKMGEKNPKFGYIITGKDGLKNGFYKMYIPKMLLDLMYVKPSELAGFIDGDQRAATVTETPDGGALISLTLSFSTRRIEAGKALPLSLAASKSTIKKGKKANLFGWLSTKKKGQKVQLYKKEKGKTGWTLITELTTKKKGYFSYLQRPTKTTKYKALYLKKSGKKVWSPVKTVKVK